MSSAVSNPTSTSPADRAGVSISPDPEPRVLGLMVSTWIQLIAIISLGVLLFWPNLRRLWAKTNPFYGEPNWGHAIFVPVIGLFYLYLHREQLRAARLRPAWSGLAILLGGILLSVYGIWPGQNDFVKDVGMVVSIFGIVTLMCGWDVMRIAWFPIVFLICALPWPGLVYSWIASPLQRLAAQVAVIVLQLTGVDATNFGTKIQMDGKTGMRTLNVAEACAGLRSLMTFVSIAAAIAFLSPRVLWQRLILVFSAIPIAVACNSMRVAGQGLLDHYVSTAFSEGFAHAFVGLVMLIPAFFLLLLVSYILDHLFIEVKDPKSPSKLGAAARPRAGASGAPRSIPAVPATRAANTSSAIRAGSAGSTLPGGDA